MTPDHQKLIDSLLHQAHAYVQRIVEQTDYPLGRRPDEQTIERLRASEIGQHLAALANYAEGYPYPFQEDVRVSADIVARSLLRCPLDAVNSYRIPHRFYRTPLGQLLNTCMLRFYQEERPGSLLTMGQLREQFGVTRQTVHQWIDEGTFFALYIDGETRFYKKDMEQLTAHRQHKQKQRAQARRHDEHT